MQFRGESESDSEVDRPCATPCDVQDQQRVQRLANRNMNRTRTEGVVVLFCTRSEGPSRGRRRKCASLSPDVAIYEGVFKHFEYIVHPQMRRVSDVEQSMTLEECFYVTGAMVLIICIV